MSVTVKPGKFVAYKVAVSVMSVSLDRLKARPDDKELVDSQIDYREEEAIINDDMAPEFRAALDGMALDENKSFAVTYQPYEPNSIVVLPASVLAQNGYDKEIPLGTILGLDMLKGRVKFDDELSQLEVIAIKEDKGEKLIVCDSNDWNAGLKVRYDVQVVEIREPTADEVQTYSLT